MDNIAKTLGEVRKRTASSILRLGGGGRATQQSFRLEGTTQIFTPLALLYTIFDREGTPFVYLLFDKWYSFHIPSLELCISFNCCKGTVC